MAQHKWTTCSRPLHTHLLYTRPLHKYLLHTRPLHTYLLQYTTAHCTLAGVGIVRAVTSKPMVGRAGAMRTWTKTLGWEMTTQ